MTIEVLMRILLLLFFLLGCSENGSVRTLEYYQKKALTFNNILSSPSFEQTKEAIEKNADEALIVADRGIDRIVNIQKEKRTFANTVGAIDGVFNEFDKIIGRHYLLNYVSPDKVIRKEATNSINKNTKWYAKVYFREDFYRSVQEYLEKGELLTGERKIFLDDLLLAFKKNGFNLKPWQRKQLEKIKVERKLLQTVFSNNIKNYKKDVVFTTKQLKGVPKSALGMLKKGKDGSYIMNPGLYAHYSVIATHAKDPEVRKKALVERWKVAKDKNEKILTKIVKMRAQEARILGYKHFADLQVQDKMVKVADKAINFIKELSIGLEEKFKKERERLRLYKVKETGKKDAVLNSWDAAYYKNMLLKEKYSLDMERLRVYFQMENVLYGMFEVYEKIFSIRIERVIAPYKWVDDLQTFVIFDAKSSEPLGTLYLDLYPREGKYTHFAQFSILAGKKLSSGKNQRPVGVLVCNFPRPTNLTPSLLKFNQVETLFHEFGHALHNILSKTEFAANHGTAVPRDFVEAPSQMLEFWTRDKNVLDLFAWDYRNELKKIPQDFLDRFERAEKATIASTVRGQIAFGMIDMVLHTRFKENDYFDITKVTNEILHEYLLTTPPEGTSFVSTFNHAAGGYAAGYYGYQWSLAIAHDMATVFEKSPEKFLDESVGYRLRKEIYEVGKRRDVEETIMAFLGRDWSLKAYLQKLGIESKEK